MEKPSIFLTMSAAHWNELRKILHKATYGKELTNEELMNMTCMQKTKLVQNDPVICASYFEHKIH